MQNKEAFLAAGGSRLHYIPALNRRPDHIVSLAALLGRHIQGWPEVEAVQDTVQEEEEAQARVGRARRLGAER